MHPQTIAVITYQSIILGLLCYWPYIRDILNGETRPEKFSWAIWLFNDALALVTQVITQLQKGSEANWVGCGLTAAHVAGILVVFVLSLKYGVSDRSLKSRYRNRRMIVGMGVGLVLWGWTQEPLVGLAASIGIDVCAIWVTARKAYDDPGSETASTWLGYGVSGLLSFAAAFGGLAFEQNASLISMAAASFTALAYPVYIALTCLGMYFLIQWRRKTARRATESRALPAIPVTDNLEAELAEITKLAKLQGVTGYSQPQEELVSQAA